MAVVMRMKRAAMMKIVRTKHALAVEDLGCMTQLSLVTPRLIGQARTEGASGVKTASTVGAYISLGFAT